MNPQTKISEGLVTRPFEARLISDELRAKVIYFQKYLNLKRNKAKIAVGKIAKSKNH